MRAGARVKTHGKVREMPPFQLTNSPQWTPKATGAGKVSSSQLASVPLMLTDASL